MKKWLLLICMCLAGMFALSACGGDKPEETPEEVEQAPDEVEEPGEDKDKEKTKDEGGGK